MTGEVWRYVPSVPELLVSNEGRIMTAPREGTMPNGGTRQYGGKPYFGVWNKQDGRFIIVHKRRTYKVARLICEAFHGAQPDGKPVVMHLDENSANNRADNLLWGTQKENLNAPAFKTYCQARTGEHSPSVKGAIAKALQADG